MRTWPILTFYATGTRNDTRTILYSYNTVQYLLILSLWKRRKINRHTHHAKKRYEYSQGELFQHVTATRALPYTPSIATIQAIRGDRPSKSFHMH